MSCARCGSWGWQRLIGRTSPGRRGREKEKRKGECRYPCPDLPRGSGSRFGVVATLFALGRKLDQLSLEKNGWLAVHLDVPFSRPDHRPLLCEAQIVNGMDLAVALEITRTVSSIGGNIFMVAKGKENEGWICRVGEYGLGDGKKPEQSGP